MTSARNKVKRVVSQEQTVYKKAARRAAPRKPEATWTLAAAPGVELGLPEPEAAEPVASLPVAAAPVPLALPVVTAPEAVLGAP